MQFISKESSVSRQNSATCFVVDYPIHHPSLDFAIITLIGRYPLENRVVNQKCSEVVYIAQGAGEVVVEGENYPLKMGDVVLIEAGERYYWAGEMTLHISCNLSFSLEQHQTAA